FATSPLSFRFVMPRRRRFDSCFVAEKQPRSYYPRTSTRGRSPNFRSAVLVQIPFIAGLLATLVLALGCGRGAAEVGHKCDPVSDPGWNVLPSQEKIGESDSAPYRDAGGNTFPGQRFGFCGPRRKWFTC